jgi:predicted enzyme related to lactoylglutathione lyase
MTTDTKGAEAFYPRLTGWTAEPFPGMPYTVWKRGTVQVAGMMTLPDEAKNAGAPSHWLMYIASPNVDETAATATRLGAKVYVAPRDIPEVGRFAVFGDPQGAVFAVLTPTPPGGDTGFAPEIGDISWHELMTVGNKAALDFYRELFGWEQTGEMDMGPMGIYRMFGRGGKTLGGMFDKPAEVPAPPHWLLYVRVADVHSAAEVVKANGGQILNGPMEVPGGDWIVQCLDPQGAAFALHHVKS